MTRRSAGLRLVSPLPADDEVEAVDFADAAAERTAAGRRTGGFAARGAKGGAVGTTATARRRTGGAVGLACGVGLATTLGLAFAAFAVPGFAWVAGLALALALALALDLIAAFFTAAFPAFGRGRALAAPPFFLLADR